MRTALTEEYGTLVDNRSVMFERLLPGPVALVWCYLTTNELLATWLGDGKFDNRVGGRVGLYTAASSIQGTVTSVRPYSRLGYTLNVLPSAGRSDSLVNWESYVTFDMKAQNGQVRLRLKHTPIPGVYSPRAFALWHAFLDRLVASMLRVRPEPLLRRFDRVLPEYELRFAERFVDE
jgi:uncharacterized protein YndB with AHSA1/START domain